MNPVDCSTVNIIFRCLLNYYSITLQPVRELTLCESLQQFVNIQKL